MVPESRTTTGIDASTMTSLEKWRLVMPLSESTIASIGRFSYTAAMSASMAARRSSGRAASFAVRSGM